MTEESDYDWSRIMTKLLIVSNNPDRKNQLQLSTEPEPVKPIRTHKYLGIIVADNLKWNEHLTRCKGKSIKTTYN